MCTPLLLNEGKDALDDCKLLSLPEKGVPEGCPGTGKVLELSGGGGGKAGGGANILGWCWCDRDCKAAGKLWLAAKGKEKLEAATVVAPGRCGWCSMCKDAAVDSYGLMPGVLILLYRQKNRNRNQDFRCRLSSLHQGPKSYFKFEGKTNRTFS